MKSEPLFQLSPAGSYKWVDQINVRRLFPLADLGLSNREKLVIPGSIKLSTLRLEANLVRIMFNDLISYHNELPDLFRSAGNVPTIREQVQRFKPFEIRFPSS